jgi:hypothetical protein
MIEKVIDIVWGSTRHMCAAISSSSSHHSERRDLNQLGRMVLVKLHREHDTLRLDSPLEVIAGSDMTSPCALFWLAAVEVENYAGGYVKEAPKHQ